jgi:hypothetical protein
MTKAKVAQSVRQAQLPFDQVKSLGRVAVSNIALICLCAGALVYYVAGVNSLASGGYYISALRSQISQLTQIYSLLTAEKSATENPVSATAFAQAQHMIEAKDILYVFESNNVALQK